MSTTAKPPPLADMAEQVFRALDRAREPRTFFQIQRGLPRPYQRRTDELRQILKDLVRQGRAHQYAPYRSKTPRYWTREVDHYARQVMVQALDKGGVTRPLLFRKVRACLQDLPEDRLEEVLDALVDGGHVRELPPVPGGRSNALRAGAPEPADYLVPVFRNFGRALHRVLDLLESEGVPREQALEEVQELWQRTLSEGGASGSPEGDEDDEEEEEEES